MEKKIMFYIFTLDEKTEKIVVCRSQKWLQKMIKQYKPIWRSKGYTTKEEARKNMMAL
jgi:hypothetical protein